jgi:hypothetical protein
MGNPGDADAGNSKQIIKTPVRSPQANGLISHFPGEWPDQRVPAAPAPHHTQVVKN